MQQHARKKGLTGNLCTCNTTPLMPQVKTSMLAIGACERVKKIARMYPRELSGSPILTELVKIISEAPGTPLGGAAMSALATLSLSPEGRQQIWMLGGTNPLIRCVLAASPQASPACFGRGMGRAREGQGGAGRHKPSHQVHAGSTPLGFSCLFSDKQAGEWAGGGKVRAVEGGQGGAGKVKTKLHGCGLTPENTRRWSLEIALPTVPF